MKRVAPPEAVSVVARRAPPGSAARAVVPVRAVQATLLRAPTKNRKGFIWISDSDPLIKGEMLLENTQLAWYEYLDRDDSKLILKQWKGGDLLTYDLKTKTYHNIDDELGTQVTTTMQSINQDGNRESGVHYAHNYKYNYEEHWQEEWEEGYADPEYFVRVEPMTWRLQEGKSASAAIKAWLRGPTIAECATSLVVSQLDALRGLLGDAAFDRKFGSTSGADAEVKKLYISGNLGECIPEDWIRGAGTTGDGTAALRKGAKYFFGNHSKYTLKHPEGVFQGENCIYLGDGLWMGFGVGGHTTAEMYELMVDEYNENRTEADYKSILLNPDLSRVSEETIIGGIRQGKSFKAIYTENLGEINPYVRIGTGVPDQITTEDLLQDPQAGVTSQGLIFNLPKVAGL